MVELAEEGNAAANPVVRGRLRGNGQLEGYNKVGRMPRRRENARALAGLVDGAHIVVLARLLTSPHLHRLQPYHGHRRDELSFAVAAGKEGGGEGGGRREQAARAHRRGGVGVGRRQDSDRQTRDTLAEGVAARVPARALDKEAADVDSGGRPLDNALRGEVVLDVRLEVQRVDGQLCLARVHL